MSRKITGSWLDAFVEYMEPFAIPRQFSTWAGLVTLAGAVERKVWHTTPARGPLYPNLYALLVGPASSGKTLAIREARKLIKSLETHFVAPSNITRAAFVDELNEATRRRIVDGFKPLTYNALTVMSNEFGVFLPTFEMDFLSVLTDMWDGDDFSERKRKLKDKIEIPNSTVNILAGWTPSALAEFLPDGAWEQGFMSRMVIVYGGTENPSDLWVETNGQEKHFVDLAADLKHISDLYGHVEFAPDAKAAIREWHLRGGPPRPDHPQLHTYTQRRTAQLIKLCTLVSISYSDDRVIALEHYQHALNLLSMAEQFMPDVFKAMQTGGDMKVMKEVHWMTCKEYLRKGEKPVAKRFVLSLLAERTPGHNVGRLADVMVRAGMLDEDLNGYTPRMPKSGRPGD